MKFKTLSGDVNWQTYGGKFVSSKLNNGEFDYWMVIDFVNMEEACGRDNEGQPRYHVALNIVSPSEAGSELAKAFECCNTPEEYQSDEMAQVEALSSYGVYAVTWQQAGNNVAKLMRAARQEAKIQAGITFGFAMDRAVNRIGTTGWEALRGDLNAGMARTIASGSTEGKILAKMHGIPALPLA